MNDAWILLSGWNFPARTKFKQDSSPSISSTFVFSSFSIHFFFNYYYYYTPRLSRWMVKIFCEGVPEKKKSIKKEWKSINDVKFQWGIFRTIRKFTYSTRHFYSPCFRTIKFGGRGGIKRKGKKEIWQRANDRVRVIQFFFCLSKATKFHAIDTRVPSFR